MKRQALVKWVFGLVLALAWLALCAQGAGAEALPGAAGDDVAPQMVPNVPINVQASEGIYTEKIRVNWNLVSGATRYEIQYRIASVGSWTNLSLNVTGTAYDHTSANAVYKYEYHVAACNLDGCSNYSAISNQGWLGVGVPANVQASDGTFASYVFVFWNTATHAEYYRLFRAESEGGTKSDLPVSVTNYAEDTSAQPGKLYYYWVRGCNDNECSPFSASNTGYRAFSAPTNVQASRGTYCDHVDVSWAYVTGADYYKIERGPSSGPDTEFSTGTNWPAFYDTPPMPSLPYYYWIRACANATGCGLVSAPVWGYRGPPPATGTTTATNKVHADRVYLQWSSVSGASTYTVYRGTSLFSQTAIASNISGTAYNDYTAHCAIDTYYYSVAACNSCGCGERGPNATGAVLPCTATPTVTWTPTRTATPTITRTPTRTATSPPGSTSTPTWTATRTPTITSTPTPTTTSPPGSTSTPTPTTPSLATATATNTLGTRPTATPSNTRNPWATATETATKRPTQTPTNTLRPGETRVWYRVWLPLVLRERR